MRASLLVTLLCFLDKLEERTRVQAPTPITIADSNAPSNVFLGDDFIDDGVSMSFSRLQVTCF